MACTSPGDLLILQRKNLRLPAAAGRYDESQEQQN